MGTSAHKEYAEFKEKVERTVYLDNLGPQVTTAVLKTALGQFGNVINAQFIPNYIESPDTQQYALVEMETPKQAKAVISDLQDFPFMMSGMPRPVRAKQAEAGMFCDRPVEPRRKTQFRWLDPSDPEFKVAQKLKDLTTKHAAEASLLLQYQLEEEQKLAQKQEEMLKTNHKKYDLVENLVRDGTLLKLGRKYRINVSND